MNLRLREEVWVKEKKLAITGAYRVSDIIGMVKILRSLGKKENNGSQTFWPQESFILLKLGDPKELLFM